MYKQKIRYLLRMNPALRLLMWPIENLYRVKLQWNYLKSEDRRYIRELHDRHKGERCFIIGNGPSLQPEDLDKLSNEITFAANRIYYIYPKTIWRPRYYLSMDNDIIMEEIDNIKSSGEYEKFLNYKAKKYGRTPKDNIWYLHYKGSFSIIEDKYKIRDLSIDVSHHVTKVGTITVTAMELAIYMGCKEIYLLGVDNNYLRKRNSDGKIYTDPSVKASYFEGMKGGDDIAVQHVDITNDSYAICKAFAERNGVKIFNATRGGKLKEFERIDFDELMGKENIKS